MRYLLTNRILMVFLLILTALANSSLAASATPNFKRLALVIGNGAYLVHSKLTSPVNDAKDLADLLKKIGFEVILKVNADQSTMKQAVSNFLSQLNEGDDALFFFSGHGVQFGGENYLIAINTDEQMQTDLALKRDLLEGLKSKKTATNIIILDACRNNPFLKRKKGFDSEDSKPGLSKLNLENFADNNLFIIAYAAQPGETALDGGGGKSGRNSVYSGYLLRSLKERLSLDQLITKVSKAVEQETDKKQRPWKSSSGPAIDYYLVTDHCKLWKTIEYPASITLSAESLSTVQETNALTQWIKQQINQLNDLKKRELKAKVSKETGALDPIEEISCFHRYLMEQTERSRQQNINHYLQQNRQLSDGLTQYNLQHSELLSKINKLQELTGKLALETSSITFLQKSLEGYRKARDLEQQIPQNTLENQSSYGIFVVDMPYLEPFNVLRQELDNQFRQMGLQTFGGESSKTGIISQVGHESVYLKYDVQAGQEHVLAIRLLKYLPLPVGGDNPPIASEPATANHQAKVFQLNNTTATQLDELLQPISQQNSPKIDQVREVINNLKQVMERNAREVHATQAGPQVKGQNDEINQKISELQQQIIQAQQSLDRVRQERQSLPATFEGAVKTVKETLVQLTTLENQITTQFRTGLEIKIVDYSNTLISDSEKTEQVFADLLANMFSNVVDKQAAVLYQTLAQTLRKGYFVTETQANVQFEKRYTQLDFYFQEPSVSTPPYPIHAVMTATLKIFAPEFHYQTLVDKLGQTLAEDQQNFTQRFSLPDNPPKEEVITSVTTEGVNNPPPENNEPLPISPAPVSPPVISPKLSYMLEISQSEGKGWWSLKYFDDKDRAIRSWYNELAAGNKTPADLAEEYQEADRRWQLPSRVEVSALLSQLTTEQQQAFYGKRIYTKGSENVLLNQWECIAIGDHGEIDEDCYLYLKDKGYILLWSPQN